MTPSCLSLASILRCESFSKLQYLALIIPTCLELLFSTSLVVTNRGSGRTHLLLVAEGWMFLALTLLDLLSHLLPAARNSVSVFKALDILIGSFSFVPILLYTSFIFLFARTELVPHLPERFQKVSMYTLFLFIPTMLLFNEVASFVGISHGMLHIGSSAVIAVGFKTPRTEAIFSFFSSLTLALLTAYQGSACLFTCYRVMNALADRRRIEIAARDENRIFRATGWIAGGLLLGFLETVVGFAQDGFGAALTRRILRFLTRACLAIGLAKGMDTLEDVRYFLRHDSERPASGARRPFISSPRLSTFKRLSQTAVAFHARLVPPLLLPAPGQRVTVTCAPGQPPMLELRFSNLGLPSPAALVRDIKARATEWVRRPCSYTVALPPVQPGRTLTVAFTEPPKIYNTFVHNAESVVPVLLLPPASHPSAGLERQVRARSVDSASSEASRRTRVPSVSSIDTQDLFSWPITPPAALKRMLDREGHVSAFIPPGPASPPASPISSPAAPQTGPPGIPLPSHNARTAQWAAAAFPDTDSVPSARDPQCASPPDTPRPWTSRPASSDDECVTIHRAVSRKAQLASLHSIKRAQPAPAAQSATDSSPGEQMPVLPDGNPAGPVADVDEMDQNGAVCTEDGPPARARDGEDGSVQEEEFLNVTFI